MYLYTCYEVTIGVPFPCRWLAPAAVSDRPDVVVEDGDVPPRLDHPLASDRRFDAEPGRFLWRGGSRAGRFLVEEGRRVTVDRGPEAEDEMCAAQLLSQVLPAVMRQRGLAVLHADAVVASGAAVGLTGASGAGKTTTTVALLDRAAAHLADDALVLRRAPDRGVVALPGPARLHLADDAAGRLGLDVGRSPRYPLRPAKAVVVPEARATTATPLGALFVLGSHPGPELQTRRLRGAEAFSAIQDCIYGPLLPDGHRQVFPSLAAAADTVAVHVVRRPEGRWTAGEVAEVILGLVAASLAE